VIVGARMMVICAALGRRSAEPPYGLAGRRRLGQSPTRPRESNGSSVL